MARTVKLRGTQAVFPTTCVVCQKPAEQSYKVDRVFSYYRRTITISLPVPMCNEHYLQATTKSPTEKLVGKIGLIVGALVGIASMLALLLYWSQTGQGEAISNVLIAAVAGIGFFMIIWAVVFFWIAPIFAFPASKVARKGVSLSKFDPRHNLLSIKFTNDQVADSFQKVNGANVVV